MLNLNKQQAEAILAFSDQQINAIQIAKMEAELLDDREMGDIIKRCEEDLEAFCILQQFLKQIETTHQ